MRRAMPLAVLAVLSVGTLASAAGPPYPVPPAWVKNRPLIARFDSLRARQGSPVAWTYLDSLVAGAREQPDRQLLIQALIKRGGTRAFLGDIAIGEPDLIEARRLAESIRDTLGQILAIQYRAHAREVRDEFEISVPLWKRMHQLARAWNDPDHEAWARMGLAYADLENNRAEAARAGYREAIPLMARVGDPFGLQEARIGLARAAMALRDYETARTIQLDVLDDARRAGNPVSEAHALNNLGAIEDYVGDPAAAADYYRRAGEVSRAARVQLAVGRIELNYRNSMLALGRYDEATRSIDSLRTVAIQRRDWDLWARTTNVFAEARFGQKRFAATDTLAGQVLARRDSLRLAVRLDAARMRMAVRLTTGKPLEALALFDRELAQCAASERGEFSRALAPSRALALLRAGRPREGLALLPAPDVASRQNKQVEGSFSTETLRAHCYQALGQSDSALAAMRSAIRLMDSGRARSGSIEWRISRGDQLSSQMVPFARIMLDAPSMGRPELRARRAYETLAPYKARSVMEQVRAWSAADSGGPAPPRASFSLDQLQRRVLAPGELLLDYYTGADGSLLFAITREGFRMCELPAQQDLADRSERLLKVLLESSDRQARALALQGMASLLFDDAAPEVAGCRRLLISADGPLSRVPFGALPAGDDAALIVTREMALLPSALTLLTRSARPGRPAAHPMLAIAGATDAAGRPMSGASAEVRWLTQTLAGVETRLPGQMRSAAELAPRLAGYDAIHIASHTTLDGDNPWNSGVLLGAPTDPQATLRAAVVARTRLPGQLCVLSGCTSIGSRWSSGEGMLGLSTAFLTAGASCVVGTLWPIEDQVGDRFTRAFYTELGRGSTVAASLRQAQLALRGSGAGTNPQVWAAFTLIGDPDRRLALKTIGKGARTMRLPGPR